MKPPSSPPDDATGGLFDGILARGPVRGLVGDPAWLQAMLDVEAALARAEASVGLFPWECADAIGASCRAERFDVGRVGAEAAAAGNPVVPLVRALTGEVRRLSGDEPAGWVHFGATSQDVLDTAASIVCRRALLAVEVDLRAAAESAATLARAHRETLVATRTLLQQALPGSFGLKAATWLVALAEAADGVSEAAARLPAQLGGAAGTLASLGEQGIAVLTEFARELALPEPVVPWHTNRLPVARVAAAAGAAAGTVGKVAGDVVLLAQTEVAEVAESAGGRGGSSTMPHKRNPVAAVAARAAAYRAPALVASLLASMPQEHERAAGAWHAEWEPLRELLVCAGSAAAWLRDCLTDLEVDPARMRRNLDATGGLLLAERVSTALRPALGRLAAHEAVERACHRAVGERRELVDVLLATPEVVDRLGEDRLRRLLDPATYLGSATTFVDRALQRHRLVTDHLLEGDSRDR